MPWIPNFGLGLWPSEPAPEHDQASREDTGQRQFVVTFVIEDPPTRRRRHSQIALHTEAHRNAAGVEGIEMPVRFERNEDGRLGAISFRPTATSADEAVRLTYPIVMSQVSFWSAVMGIPIGVYGMAVLDERHEARFEGRPQHAAAETFWLPRGLQIGVEWEVVLGLYREGKASSSPYFQFLMFFKVLEGFYERKSILTGSLKRNLTTRGVEYREPPARLTAEMLGLALAPRDWVTEWNGKSYGELYKYLDRTHRRRISHTFPKEEPPLNPDDWVDYHATVFLSNLLDQVARDLIVGNLSQMVVREAEAPPA